MDTNTAGFVPPWRYLLDKIYRRLERSNVSKSRIRRRRAVTSFLSRHLSWFKIILFCIGYTWMVVIPSPQLGRGTYIDENALQPGQVNMHWDWGDVHNADKYLEKLEMLRDMNSTNEQRAQFIAAEFNKLGISASTQNYTFSAVTGHKRGTNAYGILSSPRTPGTEAMVISASWLSRSGEEAGTLNLRGVSTVLALAGFLKRYSLWAKDLIFVISDGYLDGMHAWLATYHGSSQSNLEASRLELSSGVIWTALDIDYPGHSFSHLGIFYEGINGRLPNQDLLNSFERISRYHGGVPVSVYDHEDSRVYPSHWPSSNLLSWIAGLIYSQEDLQTYAYQAANVARHIGYQARGRPSGVHGLFHQFRIDAFTLFAVPATGPHGFHAIGRVVESTLRTTNNLLERLHASFFFYILTGPDRFLKIGSFLPSAILISISMMLGGLRLWTDAAQTNIQTKSKTDTVAPKATWSKGSGPILQVLGIMTMTQIFGGLLFAVVTSSWFIKNQEITTPLIFVLFSLTPPVTVLMFPTHTASTRSASSVLKAVNLCLASAVISITTVLNFSLAASLAVLLGIPLSLSSVNGTTFVRLVGYIGYTTLGLGWLFFTEEVQKAIWDWEILSVWFAPFVCLVYVPLVLQAGFVCLLP